MTSWDLYCEIFRDLGVGEVHYPYSAGPPQDWTLRRDNYMGGFAASRDWPGGGELLLDDFQEEYWALASAMVMVDEMLALNAERLKDTYG